LQLPLFVKKLKGKVWCIDCSEKDFPRTIIQIVRLGLDFITIPDQDKQYQQLERFKSYIQKTKKKYRLNQIITATRKALEGEYMVLETDKNMGPSIITLSHYKILAKKILNDRTTFRKVNTTQREIEIQFKNRTLHLSDDVRDKLMKEYNPHIANFRGMPKVHKSPIVLRPVVNAKSVITTMTAKIIQKCLEPIIAKMDTVNVFNIHRTETLIMKLKNANNKIITGITMDALDVKSLYTSIPINLVKESIRYAIREFRWEQFTTIDKYCILVTDTDIIKLVDIYLDFNYVEYEDVLYAQITGIPTGGNASPVIAMICLSYLEILFKENYNEMWTMYQLSARYLDDWIIITNDIHYDRKKFQLIVYNDIFELEKAKKESNNYTFLDLQIDIRKHQFYWKLHRKPGNAYDYLHRKSFLPTHVKEAFIKAEVNRIKQRSRDVIDANKEIKFFKQCLYKRGYDSVFIHKAITKIKKEKVNKTEQKWLTIPYNNILPMNDINEYASKNRLKISFRNQQKLRILLAKRQNSPRANRRTA
jgi:hypothetical protein